MLRAAARFIICLSLWTALSARAQPIITTFAGAPYQFDGDGKRAIQAPLGHISAVAVDSQGQVYVADPDNHMVMRFTPNGILNVIAGNGMQGYSGDGGPATRASLNSPASLFVDAAGNLFISDYGNQTIRKLAPDGTISTISSGQQYGYDLRYYGAFALDPAGNLYIGANAVILEIATDGTETTIAGTGKPGYSGDNGPGTSAAITTPAAIALDRSGNIYFSDHDNLRVRKISNGIITTVAGNGNANFGFAGGSDNGPALQVALAGPLGLAFDSAGNLYIADSYGPQNRVRRLSTTGNLTTVAGSPTMINTSDAGFSGDGGSATAAMLNNPSAVAIDSAGNLYIADTGNSRIRRVNPVGAISTAAGNGGFGDSGDGGPAVNASFLQPADVAVDTVGNVYVADPNGQRVRKIDTSGTITTFAGNGEQGFTGDGGPAVNASFNSPTRVAVDRLGNVFIVDYGNFRIRKVAPGGTITTIAGGGSSGADGILATTAGLSDVYAITVDSAGIVYISDGGVVRKITSDGKITRVAGGGQAFADGVQATNASFTANSLTFDAAGNLYLADVQNYNRVRKVAPSGVITTVAGNDTAPQCSGEGGPATTAGLGQVLGMVTDSAGNLYLSDTSCQKVWQVSASGVLTTFAGGGPGNPIGDGGPAINASFSRPGGIALDPQGNVYIADTGDQLIRRVLTAAPAFGTTPGTLTFSASASGTLPPPQNLALTTAFSGPVFQINLSTTDGNAWLSTNALGGTLPTVLQVYADPTGLDPGAYQGTISISVPGASPPQRSVPVAFNVGQTLPPNGSVDPASLSFSLSPGGGPLSRQINISNQGGGALTFTSSATTGSGGAWLTISPASGTATPTAPAFIAVSADPTNLSPGTYTGAVLVTLGSGAVINVPVTATVTAGRQQILLSQTGLTFTAVSGGGVVPPQTFGVLNLGQGQMSWTANATTLAGGANWLSISPNSGSTDAASLTVPLVTVNVNQAGLAPGSYYGQIQISAGAADNTPQIVTVVLNVLAPGSDPGPLIRPTGLIFTTPAGANPGSQNVLVSNLSAAATSFISGQLSDAPGNLFKNQPAQASVAPNSPVTITVQPALAGVDPQVYRGTLTLQFATGAAQTVSLLFVVAGGGVGASDHSARVAGCTPSKLVPLFTSLSYGFNVAAAWPTPVEIRVVDDCGNPIVDGAVVATFSNGDPPLSLTSLKDGRWTGTWLPLNTSQPQVVLTVKASVPGAGLSGTAQVTGGLQAGVNPPAIPSGAVVDAASLAQQAPLAPGTLITITGSGLADGPATAPGYPLPTQLGTTSLLIAGRALPLLNVAPGVVNAQIPYGLPVNAPYQLVLQHGVAVAASPEELTIATAQPAIFTSDQSGTGQGLIYKMTPGGAPVLADASNPLQPGDQILIRCTGLGAVTPLLMEGIAAPADSPPSTTNSVTLSIGGVNAQVGFRRACCRDWRESIRCRPRSRLARLPAARRSSC